MTNIYPFGATFKYLREGRGISLKEAAGEIMSPQLLSQFENGKKNVSLINFNRLLISIGVPWGTFVNLYDGDDINMPNKILMKFATEGKRASTQPVQEEIRKELEPYLRDNMTLKKSFLNHLKHHSQLAQTVSPNLSLIKEISKIDYLLRNALELSMFVENYSNLDFPMLQKEANELLNALKTTADSETLVNCSTLIPYILSAYSRRGFYGPADKLCQEYEEVLPSKFGFVSLYVILDFKMEKSFHLLRQNKPEGLELARQVINLLENPITLGLSPDIHELRKRFILDIYDLNKTGLPLFEEEM